MTIPFSRHANLVKYLQQSCTSHDHSVVLRFRIVVELASMDTIQYSISHKRTAPGSGNEKDFLARVQCHECQRDTGTPIYTPDSSHEFPRKPRRSFTVASQCLTNCIYRELPRFTPYYTWRLPLAPPQTETPSDCCKIHTPLLKTAFVQNSSFHTVQYSA